MSEIIPIKVAHLELCSERHQFDGGSIEIIARGTLAVHESLLGRGFKLVFPTLISKVKDYVLVPVELKLTRADDGEIRKKVEFAKACIKGATEWKEIAHPTTAEFRELVTHGLFIAQGRLLLQMSQDIAAA